jgi:hypothetical protein
LVDRRYSADRRATGPWIRHEPPAEHIRNAMQLLVNALESENMTRADFARLTESALARLSLALAAIEGKSR